MKALTYLLAVLFIIISATNTKSQWLQANGPNTNAIRSIAISGQNIFAATNNSGLYMSTDNGVSWNHINGVTSYVGAPVQQIATNGSNIYYTNSASVFMSSNNGATWSNITGTLPGSGPISISGNYIYVAIPLGGAGGVYRSSNNGSSWDYVGFADSGIHLTSVASSGNFVFVSTDAYPQYGVYLSTNNGANWTLHNDSLKNQLVQTVITDGNTTYAGCPGGSGTRGSVFRCIRNGSAWGYWTMLLDSQNVTSIATLGNTIYAGSRGNSFGSGLGPGGVIVSTNNGANWSRYGLSGLMVQDIAVDANKVFAGTVYPNTPASGDGLWSTSDNGSTWGNNGFTGSMDIYSMISVGSNILAGTVNGIYLSSNNGSNWFYANSGTFQTSGLGPQVPVKSFTSIGNNIFASFTYSGYGVFLSTNIGRSWNAVNNGFPNGTTIIALAASGNNVFATAGSTGVFMTTNNGGIWNSVNNGLPGSAVKDVIAASGNNVFVGAYGSGIYLSTNNGASWTAVNNGLPSLIAKSFTTSGTEIFAGLSNNLCLSTNNGTIWSTLHTFPSYVVQINVIANGADIIVATQSDGLYLSIDGGSSWSSINSGMPYNGSNLSFSSLVVNNNSLFAGLISGLDTTNGIWFRPLSQIIGINEISSDVPKSFALHQNYPNPFNPTTNIQFAISKQSLVKLVIYDVLGREVETVVNQRLNTGTYKVDWDASNQPSGIYFYKLLAGDFSETRKMALVK